jgi:membrane-bound lytic murein transglycosylase A
MLKTKKILLRAILLITALGLFGCRPALKRGAQSPEEALVQVRFFYPTFRDDLRTQSLVLAIERNIEYLNRLDPGVIFHYGPHQFTCQQVRESQEAFLKLIAENPDPEKLNREIWENFLIYQATGGEWDHDVLFTGYYEPVFEGSLAPDETFKYPIYRKPEDLLRVDLSLFSGKYKGQSIIARVKGRSVLPYYSRHNIEMERALQGRSLEIAWLKDPLDVAFLHIQGSGRLKLPDGNTISVGYAASNGRPYRSIGRYMLDKGLMNEEEMSMQGIRRYLSEHPEIISEVLNHNPSYVFFQIKEKGPMGNIDVPLTPGRSLALDSRLFPKGALAFISCQKPVLSNQGKITEWTNFSRFVLNQDTGGAIKGAGRADLFWGTGPYAEMAAGHMKHDGELYILIKRFD